MRGNERVYGKKLENDLIGKQLVLESLCPQLQLQLDPEYERSWITHKVKHQEKQGA